MCSVSAISDYYLTTWPNRFPNNPNPFQGLQPHQGLQGLVGTDPNADLRRDMATVLRLLDSIDKRLGDIECSDGNKAKFLAQFQNEDNLGEELSG